MANNIKGLASLKRKLKQLPIVAQKLIREAMAQSAEEIVAMMKSLVAVDSGDLRKSIGWTWGKAPKGAKVVAMVQSTDSESTITIYAGDGDAWYARLIEFGTAPHTNGGMFPGTLHPGTSAKPFFYVSYRALRKRVKSRISRAMTKAAKQVAASGGS